MGNGNRLTTRKRSFNRITDNVFRPAHTVVLIAAFGAGCAVAPVLREPIDAIGRLLPTPFSLETVVDGLPSGWHPYRLFRFKPMTQFAVVREGGAAVVQAKAEASASGIQQRVSVDLKDLPVVSWRWKVPHLIAGADNTVPASADAPARVIFTFEGGREKLPDAEQLNYDLAKAITGNELPYATLMYIWEPNRPEGEIITHYNTTRVKMIVAGNASRDLNRWHEARFNLLEDYRRAFGEEPPRVKTVGLMADSDNTRTSVTAYFGDIRFHPR